MRYGMKRAGIAYVRANLGKTDPRYGGVLTDISKLPVGTEFLVRNGYWPGRIVSNNSGTAVAIAACDAYGGKESTPGTIRGSRIMRTVRLQPSGSDDNILAVELL